jgi:hypothetical protein
VPITGVLGTEVKWHDLIVQRIRGDTLILMAFGVGPTIWCSDGTAVAAGGKVQQRQDRGVTVAVSRETCS